MSNLITRGFGGTVPHRLASRGFGANVYGPIRFSSGQVYTLGIQQGLVFVPGIQQGQSYQPGIHEGQVSPK